MNICTVNWFCVHMYRYWFDYFRYLKFENHYYCLFFKFRYFKFKMADYHYVIVICQILVSSSFWELSKCLLPEHSFMLKSYGWVGWLDWGGSPCDFSVILSLWTSDLSLTKVLLVLTLGLWTFDLGLTINSV